MKALNIKVTIIETMLSSRQLGYLTKLSREKELDLDRASALLNFEKERTKKELYKLKIEKAIFSPAKGRYIAIAPERWLRITQIINTHPSLSEIVDNLLPFLNELQLFVVYGSIVDKKERDKRDIDIILVVPKEIKEKIEKALGGMEKLDLHILTTEKFIANLNFEPLLLKQAVNKGVIILGDGLAELIRGYKIPKEKISEYLELTESAIQINRKMLNFKIDDGIIGAICYSCFLRARLLCILETGSADYETVRNKLNEFVKDKKLVKKAFEVYRNEKKDGRKAYAMSKKELVKLVDALEDLLQEVKDVKKEN
ncbi:MAG: hypothetical protein QXF56_00415 [Candidatus Micrarchaeia archaeon]